MAYIADFEIDIIDAATGMPLPSTMIGNRRYIAATNQTFHIRCTCKNLPKYTAGGKRLDAKPILDGHKLGYSKTMNKSSHVFEYRYGPKGKHSLLFMQPEYIDMDETENANKIAVQLNAESDVGTIKVELWETKKAGKEKAAKTYYAVPSVTANDTKKFFDKPNVSTGCGEKLGDFVKLNKTKSIRKYCEIKVWIQSPLVIDVLKRRYDELNENDDDELNEERVLKVERIESTSLKRSSTSSESREKPMKKKLKLLELVDLSLPADNHSLVIKTEEEIYKSKTIANESFDLTNDEVIDLT